MSRFRRRLPFPLHFAAALVVGTTAMTGAVLAYGFAELVERVGAAAVYVFGPDEEDTVAGMLGPSFSLLMVDPDDGEVVAVPATEVGLRLDEGWGLADEAEQNEADTGCWD